MNRSSFAAGLMGVSLFVLPLGAQQVGGQVLADGGVPARGAVVQLLDSAHTAVNSTSADSSGAFYLNTSRAGTYVLRVRLSGLPAVETGPFRLSGIDDFHQERITISNAASPHVYFDFQVDQKVTAMAGNRSPQYPPTMWMNHVQGEVLMQFVVDSTGRPLVTTAKTLRTSHDDFTQAVLVVLPTLHFNPARLAGRPVAQLVQMPFQFKLTP